MKKVFFLSFLVLMSGCSKHEAYYERTFLLMGTFVKVKVEEQPETKKAVEEATEQVRLIERDFNVFDPESEISRLNSLGDKKSVAVSDDIASLISTSKKINLLTKGVFDITIGRVEGLWGFYDKDSAKYPETAALNEAIDSVGLDKISIDEKMNVVHFKDPGTKLDFNAIAKGYAVDKFTQVLMKHGIKDAVVDIGGDVYCMGENIGESWRVGIRNPTKKGKISALLELKNRAVATSGGYENYVRLNERQYPHIIDPRTGYPVHNGVVSATVISSSCALADGMATAFFILTPEESIKIAEENADIDCVIISEKSGKLDIYISSGIKDHIKILEDS